MLHLISVIYGLYPNPTTTQSYSRNRIHYVMAVFTKRKKSSKTRKGRKVYCSKIMLFKMKRLSLDFLFFFLIWPSTIAISIVPLSHRIINTYQSIRINYIGNAFRMTHKSKSAADIKSYANTYIGYHTIYIRYYIAV